MVNCVKQLCVHIRTRASVSWLGIHDGLSTGVNRLEGEAKNETCSLSAASSSFQSRCPAELRVEKKKLMVD